MSPLPRRVLGLTLVSLAVGLALGAVAAAHAAPVFRITLVSGAPGQPPCQIEALNDLGHVAGRCGLEGFVWTPDGGGQRLVDPAHPQASLYPTAINTAGQVAGTRSSPDYAVTRGFVWSPGSGFTYFGNADRRISVRGLNDAGVAAGHTARADDFEFAWKAFRWQADTGLVYAKPSRDRRLVSMDINEAGQIAGTLDWLPGGRTHAVRMELGGGHTQLVDSHRTSQARAINDAGDVAGALATTVDRFQAFVWRESTGAVVIDPRTGNGDDSFPEGINAARRVVGSWLGSVNGQWSEGLFYWDEPSGWSDLLALIDPADPLRPLIGELSAGVVRLNARGQVAANAYDTAGDRTLMLLLTPMTPP